MRSIFERASTSRLLAILFFFVIFTLGAVAANSADCNTTRRLIADDTMPTKFLDPCGCERVGWPSYVHDPFEAWADHDIRAAQRRAIAKMKPLFDSGRLAYRRNAYDWAALEPSEIEITFLACDFWVPGAMYYGSICAAGMGDGNYRDIFISTRVWSRIPALVEWEMTNVILRYFGRDEWCDRFTNLTPDPKWQPTPARRRVVMRR